MLTLILTIKDSFIEIFGSDSADLTILQMMVRAFITFILALIIIRIAGIRSFGSGSAFDIVLSITVGAVLSRCITGKYSYLACVSAATVLALMHRLFAMIAYYSPKVSSVIKGKADVVYERDHIDWKQMKKHNISLEDLMQSLRKAGLESLDQLEKAYFETDGKLSIIPKMKYFRNLSAEE